MILILIGIATTTNGGGGGELKQFGMSTGTFFTISITVALRRVSWRVFHKFAHIHRKRAKFNP